MLDIGFRDDIRTILGKVTAPHQTIFVSATIDDEINRLARKYMRDPVEINVSRDRMTVDEVQQSYVTAERRDKFRLLKTLLERDTVTRCESAVLELTDSHLVRDDRGADDDGDGHHRLYEDIPDSFEHRGPPGCRRLRFWLVWGHLSIRPS